VETSAGGSPRAVLVAGLPVLWHQPYPQRRRPGPPVLVYTGASAELDRMRVGMLVIPLRGTPAARAHVVLARVRAPWAGDAAGINQGELSPPCCMSIAFLQAVAAHAPARTTHLWRRPEPPVLVCTDASAELGRMRVGMLVIPPRGTPTAMVHDVPAHVWAPWAGDTAGINQGELYAANVLAWSAPGLLRDRDVLRFIGNMSAESALV